MKNIKYGMIGILIITIFSLSILSMQAKEKEITTNAEVIRNQKIGWGIKRNSNHEQPDCGSSNRKVLEENKGICLGNKEKKNIYLTFDEGYEAGYTPQLLEILKENNVKATFFITAHYVNTQPDLIKRMIEEGHTIGNHTCRHYSMPELSEEKIKSEVMELHQVIHEKFGYEMKYIRPPKGEYSEKTLQTTNQLGYTTVMWSYAYEDWNEDKQPEEEASIKKLLDNLHNGEIILLHGNSKTNTNILDRVIKETKNMGYEFKSLEEFEGD
ncbi:MAG: polysaccharide deacetylase family protein [Clostridia bacterium]|nr:polysaccharide deacetylase family protein [Clostridia bacterium]